jgi:hypothetical protein
VVGRLSIRGRGCGQQDDIAPVLLVSLSHGYGYRTGLTATPSPESYVSSDPASRVFKIFMAIYETNQTDWNQSNFW